MLTAMVLMLPALRRLAERSWKTGDLVQALADEFALTPEERGEMLPSGRQTRIANRTHWSLAYLNKAGLVVRLGRGHYEASPEGCSLLAQPPERITLAFLLDRYPGVRAFRGEGEGPRNGSTEAQAISGNEPQTSTPRERLEAAEKEIKAALLAELLERVRALTPEAFEQLIVDLLVKMGYGGSHSEAARRLGRSGDGGIDGIIREDALGLDAVYIQAKRYAEDNAVGAPAIQGFAGALLGNGAMKGVFVTTSRFTTAAKDSASAYRTHRIILIDGPELAALMIGHDVGVRTVQTIRVQRIDLDAYEDDET
jgi:restriction system protein